MNQPLRNKFSILVLAACMIGLPIPAFADNSKGAETTAADTFDGAREVGEPSIEGTWVAGVTNATTGAVFYSMSTFLPGGHIIEENGGTGLRTVGQGQWQRLGPLEYIRTWFYFNFSSCSPCVLSGIQKNIQIIELTEDGNSFTASTYAQGYDTNGNMLTNNYNVSNGRRCDLATSAAHCLGIVR